MWNWLKLRWVELGDEGQQNFGIFFAVPPAILFGLLLIWVLPHFSQIGWNAYKLTATLTVDGQTVTTTQIYSYNCTGPATGKDAETVPAPCRLRGEAMAIDLGAQGKLYFIMNQWNADHSALAGRDYMLDRLTLTARSGGALTANNLPAMVKFKDPTDPETAEFVDPKNFDSTFGEGVALISVKVSETREAPSTSNIKTLLPWLNNPRIDTLGKQGAAAQLHTFDFKWPPN